MKYLRRFLWFVTSRMFWIIVIAGILIIAFYTAMNTANIYILLKDGLEARAAVVLTDGDATELTKFFRRDFLENDQVLQVGMSAQSPYSNYDIRGFDHRMTLEWMWCWPWDTVARADLTERIPSIDGKVKSARREEIIAAGGDVAQSPPAWQSGRYRATLVRVAGQWKISALQLVEVLPETYAEAQPAETGEP